MKYEPWKALTASDQTRRAYQEALVRADSEISSLLQIDTECGAEDCRFDADSSLAGVPFSVKDNIAVRGFQFSCGSNILKGLTAPYTAAAVQRLLDIGALPVAKTNMDEFGMGSATENSAFQMTRNPWDTGRVPGGSSGGSAASVAAGLVPFSLGSDTGGSVRQPAAFCGIYGLKPTYGRISRYGLAAYASSLETVGLLSGDIDLLQEVFAAVSGRDSGDQTSNSIAPLNRPEENTPVAAVLSGMEGVTPEIAQGCRQAAEAMRSLGWEVKEASLPSLKYAVSAYYTIAMAEASANLARYTGIRYGYRSSRAVSQEELVRKTRNEAFGREVKLRILLGTHVLRSGFQDQYYIKAQKIRTRIRGEFDQIFSQADMILMPVFPVQAFEAASGMTPLQQKIADRFTLTANMAGIPALAFPAGLQDGLPAGMQLLGPAGSDELLMHYARCLQEVLPKDPLPLRLDPREVLHG